MGKGFSHSFSSLNRVVISCKKSLNLPATSNHDSFVINGHWSIKRLDISFYKGKFGEYLKKNISHGL
jgi:hypothetical protein